MIASNLKLLLTQFFLLTFWGSALLAQETGFLKFRFNVDSAFILIDKDLSLITKVASGDSLRLVVGTHNVEIYTPFDSKVQTSRFVYPDSTRVLEFKFRNNNITLKGADGNFAFSDYYNTNFTILTDQDSDIYFQDEFAGTGFATLNSIYIREEVTIRNPDFGTKKLTLNAQPGGRVYQYYRRPSKSKAITVSIFPGVSQIYKKQYIKGVGFSIVTTALLVTGINKSIEYSEEEKEFISLRNRYNGTSDEQEAFLLGNLTEKQHDVITKLDTQRKMLLGSALLVYAYNIFDAFTSKPKGGYRNTKPLDFYLGVENGLYGNVSKATFRVNFNAK